MIVHGLWLAKVVTGDWLAKVNCKGMQYLPNKQRIKSPSLDCGIFHCISWEGATVWRRAEGFWLRRSVEAIQIRKANPNINPVNVWVSFPDLVDSDLLWPTHGLEPHPQPHPAFLDQSMHALHGKTLKWLFTCVHICRLPMNASLSIQPMYRSASDGWALLHMSALHAGVHAVHGRALRWVFTRVYIYVQTSMEVY